MLDLDQADDVHATGVVSHAGLRAGEHMLCYNRLQYTVWHMMREV